MTKAWQVLLTGAITLLLLFTAITNLRLAYSIAAAIIFLTFALGFVYQPAVENFSMSLAASSREQAPLIMEGQPLSETFSQIISFRLEVRHLSFLGSIAFLPIAYLILIYAGNSDVPLGFGFPPTNIVIVPIFLFNAIFLPMKMWLDERRLLSRGRMFWGRISDNRKSYEFWDENGDRYGGLASLSANSQETLALIIVDRADPDNSVPSYSFLFHAFRITDKQHAPAEGDRKRDTLRQVVRG